MNTFLWILAVLLIVVFGISGSVKLLVPRERLAKAMPFTVAFSPASVKLLGLAQVLGALGLFLPPLTDTATWLTPTAATCLAVLMVLATAYNVRNDEKERAPITIVLAIVAVVIAVCRFGPNAF